MWVVGPDMDRLCDVLFVAGGKMKKTKEQGALFTAQGATGALKPAINSNTPLQHQKAASKAQSAIAEQDFKAKGYHIPQKLRIKAFLTAYPGSTLAEISFGTVIGQRGIVSARIDDLRKDGYDLIDNHGCWSIRERN